MQSEKTPFDIAITEEAEITAHSSLALSSSLRFIQLTDLSEGEGSVLFFPFKNGMGTNLEVGDILFLRERESNLLPSQKDDKPIDENGLIVQIISMGTASYPHADTKALFRIMVNIRAKNFERNHNEPPETIDELLEAKFKVRASIVHGKWSPPEGRVVTRNVDIFQLNPSVLSREIFFKSRCASINEAAIKTITESGQELDLNKVAHQKRSISKTDSLSIIDLKSVSNTKLSETLKKHSLDIHLGFYKEEPVEFFGGGFEKINLITGMKGGGKSHIAKGIISESLKGGMTAIVFDINNEYAHFPNSKTYRPGENLKFRLDRIKTPSLLNLIERIAPFSERTKYVAESNIPKIIQDKVNSPGNPCPDIKFLLDQTNNVIKDSKFADPMRSAFKSSMEIINSTNYIMTGDEAKLENQYLDKKIAQPDVVSLSSALFELSHTSNAGVIIFNIGGLNKRVQFAIVDMILETLKSICTRQAEQVASKNQDIGNYPTIYFEEAHMYMEPRVIDDLLPLIRHFGMNVFFITNTPEALPDSVFRLVDNLIMTRMLNKRDIDQVKNCGLADIDTIQSFATNLREHHALLLSGFSGSTKNFPLVFKVRDFNLAKSGETKSLWNSLIN